MLDTTFARPIGDAGNAASWPFPVLIERVSGAFVEAVVTRRFDDVQPFVDAARRLVQRGACAITTTCGFLLRHQQRLQRELPVSVLTSTLTQFARLQAALATQQSVAILTSDANALDSSVRNLAGIGINALATACLRQHPSIGLWLFECANMAPYSAALSRVMGLPVFDALTLGRELYAMVIS